MRDKEKESERERDREREKESEIEIEKEPIWTEVTLFGIPWHKRLHSPI